MTAHPAAGMVAAAIAVGYLLGSIPSGLLLMRLTGGPDPRTVGSGNIGATNVMRAGGRLLGAVTLALDAGKSVLAAVVFVRSSHEAAAIAATMAVVGHCFPIWLRLRGGKGVATFLGALAVVGFPWSLIAFAATWSAVVVTLRYVSVASISAAWAAVIAALAAGRALPDAAALAVAAAIVTVRHAANFGRLVRHEEPKLFASGRPSRAGGP